MLFARFTFCLALTLALTCSSTVWSQQLDLVLANGRVIDPESNTDGIRNVGIKDGKIMVVTEKPLNGKKVIDVKGLVVAPGCIDLHSHSQELTGSRMQACDGVTTQLELEAGTLPVAEFYETRIKEGRPINFGCSASWVSARVAVMQNLKPRATWEFLEKALSLKDWTHRLATPDQETQIMAMVEQGLKEGGIGIGILGAYAPEYGKKENYRLHQLAVRYGVPTFTHVRWTGMIEPRSSFESFQEVIAMSAATGAHVHICHFNSSSGRDIEACARLVADAQKRGVKISTEAYPYGAGSTGINAAFFRNPDWTKRMGVDYSDMVYLKTGERLTKERLAELQEKDPAALILLHFLTPEKRAKDIELLDRSVLFPNGAVASDSMPWQLDGKNLVGDIWPLPEKAISHPRSAGCFSKLMGRFVRERKVLTLMDAVRRCSFRPAQILEESTPQMKYKGRIKAGADADIIVFDADKLIDRSTFEQPAQTAAGMYMVLVGGTPVLQEGRLIRTAMPGRPVRRTVE